MTILTIVGARPQFVKASVVSLALKEAGVKEVLLHTGQHFDANMSDVFFSELGIPAPGVRLDINGGSHGEMTGRMLAEIEAALIEHKPGRVMVYGDTNSTLAGALAAAKLQIPVAHVEAGLRSFDRHMPEELNRILTDQLSDILYCPTDAAVANLTAEGIGSRAQAGAEVHKIGDVMEDSTRVFARAARRPEQLAIEQDFAVCTLHRAENTDNPGRLEALVGALNALHAKHPVVLPLHPRTKAALVREGLALDAHVIDPVGYLEMLWLVSRSSLVVTDSGGLQKEAFFLGKQCITMRDTTEWTELIDAGVNILVGADGSSLEREAIARFGTPVHNDGSLYGGGTAAARIAEDLARRE